MTSRKTTIPPILEPYLRLPSETSLLLLTGVLNATPHWLTTRVLRSAYGDSTHNARNATEKEREKNTSTDTDGADSGDVAVVLVSWLRDFDFWKQEARRGAVRLVPHPSPYFKQQCSSDKHLVTHSENPY